MAELHSPFVTDDTLTDTANVPASSIAEIVTLDPIATSSAQFRSFLHSLQIPQTNTQIFNNGTGVASLYVETRPSGSGSISTLMTSTFRNIFGGNFTAATNVIGGRFLAATVSGAPTGTITNAISILIENNSLGFGPLIITNNIGIDIPALNSGRTLNIGLRIAAPFGGLGTGNYAFQLSDTGGGASGGITFGTDVQLYRSAANILKLDDKLFIRSINLTGSALEIDRDGADDVNPIVGIAVDVDNIGYVGGSIGIDIANITSTGGTNIGIRIAAPQAGGYALQLSGTGGGAEGGLTFGTDIQLYRSTALTLSLTDAVNLSLGTGTGTKIAIAASQKIGFWNTTPIVQPTTAIAASTFVANTSLIANDSATWDGYTMGQIVKALRNVGLLA